MEFILILVYCILYIGIIAYYILLENIFSLIFCHYFINVDEDFIRCLSLFIIGKYIILKIEHTIT